MPNQYLKNVEDQVLIQQLNDMDILLAIGQEDTFLDSNYKLCSILDEKGISYQLNVWNDEAHKPKHWRKMVQLYL
jgi:esterase/lipase superfamily enzyme